MKSLEIKFQKSNSAFKLKTNLFYFKTYFNWEKSKDILACIAY